MSMTMQWGRRASLLGGGLFSLLVVLQLARGGHLNPLTTRSAVVAPAPVQPIFQERPPDDIKTTAHLIANRGNEFGRASLFWTDKVWVNPTVLVLPVEDPDRRYLLLASGYRHNIPTHFSQETLVVGLVGCYLASPLDLSGPTGSFHCGSPMIPLDLQFPEGSPLPLCNEFPILHFGITAGEDVRLWLSDDGAPMMIYWSTHSQYCRGMSVLDARAVVPDLHDAYLQAELSVDIIYHDPLRLVRDEQLNIEKNWAFLPSTSPLTFYTRVSPHEVYASNFLDPTQTLHRISTWPEPPLLQNCIVHMTQEADIEDETFRSVPDLNHLGTPYLRLKHCKRAKCRKTDPVVLFGIFNRKRTDLHYDTRALVLEASPPHNQLSLSQPLTYAGVSGHDFVYTHGLVWADPSFEDGQLIGYLDDSVLISIGISNKEGALLEVPVHELLASQMPCHTGVIP